MSTSGNLNSRISLAAPSIQIQNIRIHVLRVYELYEKISQMLSQSERHLVTYVNINTMNIARKDDRLQEAYEKSTITYCDGAGIVLGARLLGKYLPERMTSATFIHQFCECWQRESTRIFFLGGKPGVAFKACNRLQELYPDLQIVGHAHGFFHRTRTDEYKVLKKISDIRPDILFIGLGTPLQEHWALDQWERIDARVLWPIGALVDYLAGIVPRCPQWMEHISLEWLFRFLIEPQRLFGRYVIGNPLFIFRILKDRLR